jgi:hypothetical protein
MKQRYVLGEWPEFFLKPIGTIVIDQINVIDSAL